MNETTIGLTISLVNALDYVEEQLDYISEMGIDEVTALKKHAEGINNLIDKRLLDFSEEKLNEFGIEISELKGYEYPQVFALTNKKGE